MTARFPVRGSLVPDAHLAALLLKHGLSKPFMVDRHFRKFDFLEVADSFEWRFTRLMYYFWSQTT